MATSVEMARTFVEAGVKCGAATPHIREDYPFDPAEIPRRVEELKAELSRARIALDVVAGGEVAITKVPDLDDETLRRLCLGSGSYVLVESPYAHVSDLL